MGYDLHITRAADWSESEQHPITLDEFLEYVRSDPEFRRDERNPNLDMYIWSGPSQYPDPWIAWGKRGLIYTKNPDKPLIIKMTQIAAKLGARVMGDDGELYGPEGEQIFDPPADSPSTPPRKSWWDRLRGR